MVLFQQSAEKLPPLHQSTQEDGLLIETAAITSKDKSLKQNNNLILEVYTLTVPDIITNLL